MKGRDCHDLRIKDLSSTIIQGLSYNFERITRHPRIKCALLFETGVWLLGFVIQGTGFIRLLNAALVFLLHQDICWVIADHVAVAL